VTLIGDEPVPPYQRPPLSKKYLLGEFTVERLFLKPEAFYHEHDVELVLETPVSAIDRSARQVVAGQRRIGYDVLALTTGALPRRLPPALGGALGGVHVVRTLADVDSMAPAIVAGRRALIVGGGYIGLEAAAVCALKGLHVTVIEVAPRILQRVAAPQTADFIRTLHQSHGVELREGIGLERLVGDTRVEAAELAGGERIATDVAIVGIGVTPNTQLAEAAGLTIDNGIAVDELCRTSDPSILAAGDCASFPFRGTRVRLESVQNAIDQAEHAARVIMGADDPYTPVPWFWSDQYDARLQIAGLHLGYERTFVRPGHRPGGQSVWYYRGATFLAVDAVNDPKAYMQGKRWLEAGVSPDVQALTDPATDLRSLA
jgi:3-phenylpropionate/trans-cinnamate dioxygenase ferredoxin reductase subunit